MSRGGVFFTLFIQILSFLAKLYTFKFEYEKKHTYTYVYPLHVEILFKIFRDREIQIWGPTSYPVLMNLGSTT
jgi:hypothetical protein